MILTSNLYFGAHKSKLNVHAMLRCIISSKINFFCISRLLVWRRVNVQSNVARCSLRSTSVQPLFIGLVDRTESGVEIGKIRGGGGLFKVHHRETRGNDFSSQLVATAISLSCCCRYPRGVQLCYSLSSQVMLISHLSKSNKDMY